MIRLEAKVVFAHDDLLAGSDRHHVEWDIAALAKLLSALLLFVKKRSKTTIPTRIDSAPGAAAAQETNTIEAMSLRKSPVSFRGTTRTAPKCRNVERSESPGQFLSKRH